MVVLLAMRGASQDISPAPEVRDVLAPTGKLRVGLYLGSPLSMLRNPGSDRTSGIGFELGREFARRLGVPFEPVVYPGNGEVIEAMKSGKVDAVFTNATAARAQDMDFTQPYLEMETGFLVPAGSSITKFGEVDTPGLRVGVTEGSTSAATLPGLLKNAAVVRTPTLASGVEMLSRRELDAFATNKSNLFEMSDKLAGSKVLDGRYGVELLALGIPKGRTSGMAYARRFIASAVSEGLVKSAVERAGLRGGIVRTDQAGASQ
jgi:polar amino acid transport system substrate-binding protein